MKAIRYETYGSADALQFKNVAKPVPKDNEVLVQVHAASVNALDGHRLGSSLLTRIVSQGLRKPKDPRFGVDFAGRVEAVGRAVTEFQPGDDVFGGSVGAFAEYVCAAEGDLARKPANVSFEAAAAVPVAAHTALQALRDQGQVRPGEKVLVNGASGGVGTFAVQIARALGAHVTAVCSPRNVDLIRSLGADRVVDYTREDVTQGSDRAGLLEAGKVTPMIDRCYPLGEVPDAIGYLEEGHARGKIVITVAAAAAPARLESSTSSSPAGSSNGLGQGWAIMA